MPLPVGEGLALPLTLIWTQHTPPTVRRATLVASDGTRSRLSLAAPVVMARPGDRVVLDLKDASAPLVQGRLESASGTSLTVLHEGARERDKREFVRVAGGLELSWRPAPGGASAAMLDAWVKEGADPTPDVAWRRPDPFVDLSGSGLAFDDRASCREGDRLLLRIVLPEGGRRGRAVARVVRVTPLCATEREEADPHVGATHRIAVELERIAPADREALLALTVQLQKSPAERRQEG